MSWFLWTRSLLLPPNGQVKRAIRFQLQAGVHGDGCHVGDSASARLDSRVLLSLSLCLATLQTFIALKMSHTPSTTYRKKKCFGTSERLKCSSGRSFLLFRPGTRSRVEEPLQDALNMVTETSGDASQDQDLLFSYHRPVTGKCTDCCLGKEKQESKEKQCWKRLFRHISVAMTLSGLWKSFLGGNYLFWGSSDSRGTKQLCGTFPRESFCFVI